MFESNLASGILMHSACEFADWTQNVISNPIPNIVNRDCKGRTDDRGSEVR